MSITNSNKTSWKNSPLFQDISDRLLDQLQAHLIDKSYAVGDFMIREGTFGDAIFFIEKGKVEIFKDKIKLAEKQSGDYVGAMALMENTTRSANVMVTQPTNVKVLTINQLKAIESDDIYPKVLLNHLKEQQALLRKMNEATIQNAKEKVQEAENKVRLTKKYFSIITILLMLIIILMLFLFLHRH